jgi:GNAT superfamily N-acetyltransferase
MAVEIRELTPALVADWLAFFDDPALAACSDAAGCYCRGLRFDGGLAAWDAACASGANRAAMIELIGAGRVWGALAYDGGRVVGWCQFGPRTEFRHSPIRACPVDDAASVGSVVCFVVAASHRRQGVARTMLRAACDGLAHRGRTVAEGYVFRDEAAHRFFSGPRAMFEAEGFAVFRETPGATVMRKALGP